MGERNGGGGMYMVRNGWKRNKGVTEITKVTCMDVSCRWLNDQYRCTKKEIGLSWHQVMTAHDGRKEYLTCKGYEESNVAKDIREFFERAQKEGVKPDDERGV